MPTIASLVPAELYQVELSAWGSVSASNVGTGPFTNSYTALLNSTHATNALFTSTSIVIQVISTYRSAGGSTLDVTVVTPFGSYSNSSAGYSTPVVSVLLNGVKVYQYNMGYRVVVTSVDITVGGSSVASFTGGTINNSRVPPDGLPLLSTVSLVGSVTASGQDGFGISGAFDSDAISEGTVGGGIRWKETSISAWVEGPIVTPYTITDVPVGTTTYDDQFNVYHRDRHTRTALGGGAYSGSTIYETKQGSMHIFPNWDKKLYRLNDDFAVQLHRLYFPTLVNRNQESSGVLASPTFTDTNVYTTLPALTFIATTTPTTDESPFTLDTVCPAHYGYGYEEGYSSESFDNEPVVGGLIEQETQSTIFPYSVSSFTGYRNHSEAVFRYLNTWANPHWSFLLDTKDWYVDGYNELWNDYWVKVGQQVLDAGEDPPMSRNHLISEPLVNDTKKDWCDTNLSGKRFIGVSRWLTKDITPKTVSGEFTNWTVSEGTVSNTSTTVTFTPAEEVEEGEGIGGRG